jgi:hypothetical protein
MKRNQNPTGFKNNDNHDYNYSTLSLPIHAPDDWQKIISP